MVDADACAASEMGEYNVGFHIGGIFIVLLISGFGIFMTLALGAHAKAPIFARVLQIFKMFGIGVIAGTAWIHLLPDAFEAFGSPCLPSAWAEYGGAYVGVFGLTAAFLVQFIELTAIPDSVTINEGPACTDLDHVAVSGNSAAFLEAGNGPRVHSAAKVNAESQFSVNDAVPSAHSGKDTHSQHSHSHGSSERNSELGTILLESGIIFHSLIIGITLGVTPDEAFTTLLIAVSFHQLFEGMALGVLISRLNLSLLFKGLMSCAYPLTTPIGIAIGMAIRHYYNENDCAGILFYNTYTELMSGEVSHNGHFHGFTRGFKAA
ncbi:Zinc/iron permease, partial [Obelidium mucronatum]